MATEYKYHAFISYNSRDTRWGKWLQRRLEGYRMPTTLCSQHGWKRKPMNPIFFAPTDIQPGGLTAELQERLRASQNLIVVCSPRSAQSEWVGQEIAFFHNIGRTDNIHFFIVDGIPHSGDPATECFNPIVDELGMPEILGANIHEKVHRWPWLNKERAFVQLVTKLLGVEFDSVWHRHRRMLVQRIVGWSVGAAAVIGALATVWALNQPVDVNIGLKEATVHNAQLPPLAGAIVTVTLDNETKTDTIASIDQTALLVNVPQRFIGQEVDIKVECNDYMPIDTTMALAEAMTIAISRDPAVYSNVSFTLWNADKEQAVPNCQIAVDGIETTSDANGRVSLTIPIENQKPTYTVTSTAITLIDTKITMPSGENDVVIVE